MIIAATAAPNSNMPPVDSRLRKRSMALINLSLPDKPISPPKLALKRAILPVTLLSMPPRPSKMAPIAHGREDPVAVGLGLGFGIAVPHNSQTSFR
ncbi:MAG: hypothetical protein AAGU24_06590 [Dehalogenimonas sp.]